MHLLLLAFGTGCITAVDVDIDADQDGLLTSEEESYGSDPEKPDSDGDGFSDGDEVEQGKDPMDSADKPYLGGWATGQCDDIEQTGSEVGDVGANFELMDQFGEMVSLYDFCEAKAIYLVFGAFW